MESAVQTNAQIEQLTLTVSQLKRDIERRDSQIQQLNQQIAQAEKLSRMSTATGFDRDALLNELKISLQRTQKALDEANEQNHLLQARMETTMLETQQQFLIQQQALQQQIANLQQSLHEAGMNSDRLQKEVRQSSTRIQDLTRQLRETQANCDSIASQRDSLQARIEQLQQSGVRSGGSVYSGRPASVAAGYSDLISSTTNTIQLSRELDRLHREQESMRNQLDSAERSTRGFKTEAENARAEVTRLKEELQQQKDMLSELQENLESREEEMSKRTKFETEKLKKQQQDLTNQIANLQKQVSAKDNLIEKLTNQLKTAQEKCADTERRLMEATKRLDSLDSQEEQATLERNQQQRLSYELETVKKELNLRETQVGRVITRSNAAVRVLFSIGFI
ncbi:unnamed protein product [Schistocephalus solidus]|uniref:Myosin_tail_1 domain-containing protein n=1 Tax=Schistocephalus solidus TaxID=70667 RepID=A0A183SY09_SCHSO|nr:unnamed protein product [Schistocephalus solidus]